MINEAKTSFLAYTPYFGATGAPSSSKGDSHKQNELYNYYSKWR
jgi:hypothetical protein